MSKTTHSFWRAKLLLTLMALLTVAPWSRADADADPVPVAPITATEYQVWTDAIALTNDEIKVVVVPEIGRIAHLSWRDEPNLFRLDAEHREPTVEREEETDAWQNSGGDWIWPVQQAHWPQVQGEAWPPSQLLVGRLDSARAWRTEEGRQQALYAQDFGAPLHVRITRTLSLSPTQAGFTVRQKLERVAPSDISVALWQISQLEAASHIVLPVDGNSTVEHGIVSLMDLDPPGSDMLHSCGETVVYDTRSDAKHRVGSASSRAWIAALIGDTVLLIRAEAGEGEGEGDIRDSGRTVGFYSDRHPGYSEIETVSRETVLEENQQIDNTLHFSLHRLNPVPEDPCRLAKQVQRLVGEIEPEPEPEPDTEGD